MGYGEKLTKSEIENFLKTNRHGILAFSGDKPYALPMGYMYRKGTIILAFAFDKKSRKREYLEKSKRVCFTICKPRWQTPQLKVPCTSLVVEGTLKVLKNRVSYGLKAKPIENIQTYKLAISKIGARKCNRKPCELFVKKDSPKNDIK